MQDLFQLIEQTALETEFSGAVSIFKQGAAVYRCAYGERDRSNHLPNTVETRFGIASGTKLLTALGIGVLIDQDRLTVGTEVGELRGDFHTFIDPGATVGQLLTHTSGAYDYYDEDVVTDFESFYVDIPWYRLTTPSDYLPLFEGRSMKFRPGTRYSYSNGGYILLGIIIETITGRLYRDFIEEFVLVPAGMHKSGFFAFNDLPENVAFGYLAEGGQTNIYNLPIRGAADGGLYTTLDDVDRLWTALFAYDIVSEEFAQEMLEAHVTFEEDDEESDDADDDDDAADGELGEGGEASTDESGYGYGIYWTRSEWDDEMYYVVGGDAGVGFDSAYFPKQETAITILANETDGEEEMRHIIYDNLDLVLLRG